MEDNMIRLRSCTSADEAEAAVAYFSDRSIVFKLSDMGYTPDGYRCWDIFGHNCNRSLLDAFCGGWDLRR